MRTILAESCHEKTINLDCQRCNRIVRRLSTSCQRGAIGPFSLHDILFVVMICSNELLCLPYYAINPLFLHINKQRIASQFPGNSSTKARCGKVGGFNWDNPEYTAATAFGLIALLSVRYLSCPL